MENKTSGCQEIFVGISSTIGFIVDAIALVGIISGLVHKNVVITDIEFLPQLGINTIALRLSDISLVMLIYFGGLSLIIPMNKITRQNQERGGFRMLPEDTFFPLFNFQMFLLLLILWLTIYVFDPSKVSAIYNIEIWITGFVFLLSLKKLKFFKEMRIRKAAVSAFLTIFIVVPGWTLLTEITNTGPYFSFWQSFINSLLIVLGALVASLIVWILLLLLFELVGVLISGK